MEINKKNAIKLWKERYGNQEVVQDFIGRYIYIDDYNDRKTKRTWEEDGKQYSFGWNIHHIMPSSIANSDKIRKKINRESNLEIVHIFTNDEAEDKISFVIDGIPYQVRNLKDGSGQYGIYNQITNQRVDYLNK